MKRATVVKNIHKVYTHGDFFAALRFSGNLPYSGDLMCLQLALTECNRAYKVRGLAFMAVLVAASEVERKTGFITYKVLSPMFKTSESCRYVAALLRLGLLEPAPFPDTFSHILRKKRVFRISDKGRKCLRLFSDVFNMYQREVKRAKVKGV